MSVWHFVDVEVYMRMALGRIALGDLHPSYDPFLFTVQAPFGNPEWLGDILLYACHAAGGELAVVVLRVVLVSAGSVLLLAAMRNAGVRPVTASLFVVAAALLSADRWSERNETHLLWLVPAYLCVLTSPHKRLRWTLLGLGILWANLHESFVIGWALVFAALCEDLVARNRKDAIQLAIILVVHPLLPFASPDGIATYRFLWEHQKHAAWLAQHIAEWMPLARSRWSVRESVMQFFIIATLLTFLPRVNRRAAGRFVVALVAIALVYRGLRFVPLSAALLAFVCAGNLAMIELSKGIARSVACLALGVAVYVGWAERTYLAESLHPLSDAAGAAGAARWLGEHAEAGSRVFNPFNQSQLLMWFAPQVKLAVTAYRPYLGFAEWKRASSNGPAFDSFVERFEVRYVLTYAKATSTAPGFWAAIERHPRWRAVYRDRVSAVFARVP